MISIRPFITKKVYGPLKFSILKYEILPCIYLAPLRKNGGKRILLYWCNVIVFGTFKKNVFVFFLPLSTKAKN